MAHSVLIVDDSMLLRRMIAEVLEESGWTIAGEATNGDEAVRKYVELQPDVVTLDIVMPKVDGIHALEEIIEFDPKAKVVIVSALNQSKLISEAIRKGARDFIVKPFMPEQLQETVSLCIEEPILV